MFVFNRLRRFLFEQQFRVEMRGAIPVDGARGVFGDANVCHFAGAAFLCFQRVRPRITLQGVSLLSVIYVR
jgi:hypothetical protein